MDEPKFYETENFEVCLPGLPHIPKEDGGHIFIRPKDKSLIDRTMLSKDQAIELMFLTIACGKAYKEVMNEQGINLKHINYQENGNWAFIRGETPMLHIHIYGRVPESKTQEFGQALHLPYPTTGFYNTFDKLTEEDLSLLSELIDKYYNDIK